MATTKLANELAELTAVVDALAARVDALESPSQPPRRLRPPSELAAAQSLLADLQRSDGTVAEGGVVQYAGALSVAGRVLAWQMDRHWDELTTVDPAVVALALAALGSPQRVQIVQLLLGGSASTAELSARLDGRSSGQLFHHLKELLAADVIHQPARGTYAIREARVVPLLTLLSCALDVRSAVDGAVDTEST